MNREEYAERVREEALGMILGVFEELRNNLNNEGLLFSVLDEVEENSINYVLKLTTNELMNQRHKLCSYEHFGKCLEQEVKRRL